MTQPTARSERVKEGVEGSRVPAAGLDVKGRIQRVWGLAWNQGNVDAFDELAARTYQGTTTSSDESMDLDGLKDAVVQIRSAFPDLNTTIDSIIEEGNVVVVMWTSTGTHKAELFGVPPTNRPIKLRGTSVCTFEDGLIVSEETTWGTAELLESIGVRRAASSSVAGAPFAESPSAADIKGANRQFITGVTVVSTRDDHGTCRGLALNAYASVSLSPPTILVCVQKSSTTYPALFGHDHMGVSILSSRQAAVAGVFASKSADKFADVDWAPGPHGSPLICEAAAAMEAEITARFDAGTHTIFIANVVYAQITDSTPLVYAGGAFYDGGRLVQVS